MKKFLSTLFTLGIIACIGAVIYFKPPVAERQINKIKGMYYVYQGDKAYKELKMNKAIKMYNLAVKLYPGHYEAWYNLGNIYVAYEDYYSALYAYSEAFKYNPKMMIARMNYGIVATEKLGDFESAIEQYNKIITTDRKLIRIPYIFDNKESSKANKAIAYYNIGVTYRLKSLYSNDNWELQRQYLSKAIEAYKKSLEIEPNRYDTLYNLGLAYHIAGDFDNAGICYCKAIAQKPFNYEAHYNLAVLLRRLRHYQESYDEIVKAATLVTAIDNNTGAKEYISVTMNDITNSLYNDSEYRNYVKNMISEEENKIKQHSKEKLSLVKGKFSPSKNMDKADSDAFAKCPSMKFFISSEDY